jgi:formyl-CoA transferase
MHSLDSLLQDPHLLATDFYQVVQHPSEGKIRLMRSPTEWSGTPAEIRRLPPRAGEHSREILGELDYSRGEISMLIDNGVVKAADETNSSLEDCFQPRN